MTLPIPELSPSGLLEPGLHEATLQEVKARFGQFQRSDRRVALMSSLENYATEARLSGVAQALVVDGSFVTAKDEPEDVDCILVLAPLANLERTLLPATYNVISKRMVRKRHGIDLFAFPEGSAALAEWIDFFSQVKGPSQDRKGLVRIPL